MRFIKIIGLVLAIVSLNVLAENQQSPSEVVSNFLAQMKVKKYNEASVFVATQELDWLAEKTKLLLLNKDFFEMIGLESLNKEEINALTNADVFAIMAIGTWEARDKNFGEFTPENVLGSVKENDNMAHVVVRDLTNADIDAIVYTLVLSENKWRLKLPRIMKGTITIFERRIK